MKIPAEANSVGISCCQSGVSLTWVLNIF